MKWNGIVAAVGVVVALIGVIAGLGVIPGAALVTGNGGVQFNLTSQNYTVMVQDASTVSTSFGSYAATLNWGDNSSIPVAEGGSYSHTYAKSPASYVVREIYTLSYACTKVGSVGNLPPCGGGGGSRSVTYTAYTTIKLPASASNTSTQALVVANFVYSVSAANPQTLFVKDTSTALGGATFQSISFVFAPGTASVGTTPGGNLTNVYPRTATNMVYAVTETDTWWANTSHFGSPKVSAVTQNITVAAAGNTTTSFGGNTGAAQNTNPFFTFNLISGGLIFGGIGIVALALPDTILRLPGRILVFLVMVGIGAATGGLIGGF